MVNAFYEQNCAMVVGTYMMTDFNMNMIAPGIIDHNCRRWDDNSDASLDVVKMNAHNLYKDRIRTWELQARIAFNKKK